MPGTMWITVLLTVVAILLLVVFQDIRKISSLEEERSACIEQREKLAIEASQLNQQVTQLKEKQHETDRESRRTSAKVAALEEDLDKLEDEQIAWDDERERLLIREKHLKQQHDDCRIQLKAADAATTEEKVKRLRTENELEELRQEGLLSNAKAMANAMLLAKAMFGTLKTEDGQTTGNSNYRAKPVLIKQIKTRAALEENGIINGIAKLNEDLFAITADRNIIERFDLVTLSSKQQLFVNEYENVRDIQPCNQSESLFIIKEEFPGQIFISSVDPYNKETLDTWAVDSCINRLSVTEDCHVIAVCPEKNKIFEYSSTGNLLLEIVLKPEMGIGRPRLALKMTSGNFLVSYDEGSYRTGVGLAILNSKGTVLKLYSDSSQKSEFVNAMVIDRQGNILVTEMAAGRVFLLSSDLEYKRELLTRENGIGVIIAMLLDEENGRLFVADCDFNFRGAKVENGRIMVFHIN